MMAAVPRVSPEAVASHAACPVQIHATATLALLTDARAAGDNELGDLIEADLLAACRSIATAASPALRCDLVELLHSLALPVMVMPAPSNDQPPRG
jgi:hypothetical protein